MTPFRPYLVQALLGWINDNDMTPHVLVDATVPGVHVPDFAVKNGKILLNVSLLATRDLSVDNEFITFSARFGGQPFDVVLPMGSLMVVFAKETGMGMSLDVDPAHTASSPSNAPSAAAGPARPVLSGIEGSGDPARTSAPSSADDKAARRSHLRVVK